MLIAPKSAVPLLCSQVTSSLYIHVLHPQTMQYTDIMFGAISNYNTVCVWQYVLSVTSYKIPT